MARISFRVDDGRKRSVEKVADAAGLTVTDLMTMAVDYVLEQHEELVDEDTQALVEYRRNIEDNHANVLRAKFADIFDENIRELFEAGADPDHVEEVVLGDSGWIESADALGLDDDVKDHLRDRVEEYRRNYHKSDIDPRDVETTATFTGVKHSGEYERAVETGATIMRNGENRFLSDEVERAIDVSPPDTTKKDVRDDMRREAYKEELKEYADRMLTSPRANPRDALTYAPDTHTPDQVREDALTLFDGIVQEHINNFLTGEREALVLKYNGAAKEYAQGECDKPSIPEPYGEVLYDVHRDDAATPTPRERARAYLKAMDLTSSERSVESYLPDVDDETDPGTATVEGGI